MPKYRKRGGKNPLQKRFKTLNHKDAAAIHATLTENQFRALQELAVHALGYPTNYSENLPARSSKKVRPSSFKIYASAEGPADIVKNLAREKAAHDDHSSEIHMGGGLLDAINTVGTFAYNLLGNVPTGTESFEWAYNKLDPNNADTRHIDPVFTAATVERNPQTQQDGGTVQSVDDAVSSIMHQASETITQEAQDITQNIVETAVDEVKANATDWIADILGNII